MSMKEFYSCGKDCNECPKYENCHNEDGEECKYLKVEEKKENYVYPESILDQEFEDKISGDDCEVDSQN